MQLTTRRPAGDAGFTLIELLICIVILGIIAVPLGNAIISYSKNQDATAQRMALSHDGQISTAYFSRDVVAVGVRDYAGVPDASGNLPYKQSIQLNAAYNSGGLTCGDATTPQALVRFLSDDWDHSDPANPKVVTGIVAYYLVPVGTVDELHRIKCSGSATPLSSAVLAHNVDPSTVNLTCSSSCTATTVPQQVNLAFTVTSPNGATYPIALTGQRRQT